MTALEQSLDMASLRALVALGQRDGGEAVRVLDAVGARADDLEAESLKPLWGVLEERIRRHQALDLVLVAESLGRKVPLEAVMAAWDVVAPGAERELLERLRDAAARRRIVEALRQVAGRVKAGEPLAEVASALRALPTLAQTGGRVRSAVGDTARIVAEADAAWHSKQAPILRTGWEDLDAEWRLTPSLHAVGAQPGVGKSAFVAGLAWGWTLRQVKVGVLAYEDDGLDLQRRVLAATAQLDVAGVAGWRLLTEVEHEALGRAYTERAELERFLYLDDAHPRGKVSDVCASLRQMRSEGCEVGILDNLSSVRMDGGERHIAIEDALLEVRETAVDLRMPVLVIGHLKRREGLEAEESVEPRMGDFAGAASWERFARSMLGLWRAKDGGTKLKVLKQNLGRWGARFDVGLAQEAACVASVTREVPDAAPERPVRQRRSFGRPAHEAE